MNKKPDDEMLVTIGHYFSPADAHAHRLALEEVGIDACVLDEIAGSLGVAAEARLQVRAADERTALEILRADPVPASALPSDLAESPCPRCVSAEVSQTAEIPDVPPPPVEEWPSRVWRFRCSTCQHTWLEDEATPGRDSG